MDKIHKKKKKNSNSEWHTPSSEPFRIFSYAAYLFATIERVKDRPITIDRRERWVQDFIG
jgi:hypothetical protein